MGPVGPRGSKGGMGRPGLRGYRGICKKVECKIIKVKHGEDGQGNYLVWNLAFSFLMFLNAQLS